jgi:tetratricopeptide (TPR) repeat protein
VSDPRQSAAELFQQAYELQRAGDFHQAIELYTRSIQVCPTAEAYTFRGWTYSFLNDYERAIADCLEAIKVDPEFGNPYNDIGVYLMQRNQFDDAIPWLEQAKRARRYEPRHFPYLNLGRIYMVRGELQRAIQEFEDALKIAPEDDGVRQIIAGLRAKLN